MKFLSESLSNWDSLYTFWVAYMYSFLDFNNKKKMVVWIQLKMLDAKGCI